MSEGFKLYLRIVSVLLAAVAIFAHFYVHDDFSAVFLLLLAIWVKP